jgi:hypothetical protein
MNKLFLCACPEHEGYTRKPAQAWPWLAFWLLQLAWLAGARQARSTTYIRRR